MAWLGADEWSITLRLSDINYVSAYQDRQESIVDRWGRFLNSFGAGTRIQINVVNRVLDDEAIASLVQKPLTWDAYDPLRADFNKIVRGKLAAASGNTVTEKYITVTAQETDQEKAEATLSRIEHEIMSAMLGIDGCKAERLTRAERLQVFANALRPHEFFHFSEDEFEATKRRNTCDYIAPYAVERTTSKGSLILRNATADTYYNTLWVRDYPVWLTDRLITELTEIKCNLTVGLHLEPYEQVAGMSMVERQLSELEMQKITEQKKARKQHLDDDMLPRKLLDQLDEARELRAELSTSNQKMFASVMVIGVSAETPEILDQNVKRAMTVLRKQSVTAEPLNYMQPEGLTTALPVGRRAIPHRRSLTSGAAAILVPFTTQELFQPGGHWYGVNSDSANAVVADRTRNINGNGFILGTSGSGKSVTAKSEIVNTFLSRPGDDIIIIDPEREYEPLVLALGGQVIRIHAGSNTTVNPLDIELDVSGEDGDPIQVKAGFVLTLLESLVGGIDGLSGKERSIADRVMVRLYRQHSAERGLMPTLNDLRWHLQNEGDEDARVLATKLEIYTEGSLGSFAARTNVNPNNRIVSWDIKRLGPEMKTYGMMVILDQVWNRVMRNRESGRRTWLYVDEFHLLFNNAYSAEYFREMYARARKWGLIPTGVTQNIEGILGNEAARLMLANSAFLAILGQTPTDADALSALLHLSPEQRRKFENIMPGQGLLKSGTHILGFDARIPDSSVLYNLFQTTFEDAETAAN
jgi:hypothetical protein